MAQRQRTTQRQQKSSFPIFKYLDFLMPHHLVARFIAMPRHLRWTIISALASVVILWVFLRVVVGSINYWIDTRGAFLKDALYLPYALHERPLPVFPEEETLEGETEVDRFLILPDTIGEQYVLQIPPTEEEMQATNEAEVAAFLTLSLPAESSLVALRDSLAGQVAATPVPVDTEVEAATVEDAAIPATDGEAVVTPGADAEAVPTLVPTVDPVQLHLTAVDGVLTPLIALNEALADEESFDLVYGAAAQLQNRLNSLVASGATVPLSIDPLKLRIDELAAVEPPTAYVINECLFSMKSVQRRADETFTVPCEVMQSAEFVEHGEYLHTNNTLAFDITVAEFRAPQLATQAIKELYQHGRTIGSTGDFALDDTIEYNYFFSQVEGVITLTWSHENWVYSVSGDSVVNVDTMMKIFPY